MSFRLSLIAILVTAGLWLRSLPALKATAGLTSWSPWTRSKMVTLYFADGRFLFPVSRRIQTSDEMPRATLQALLSGPSADSGLTNPIPPGVEIRSFQLGGGKAQIDLSATILGEEGVTRDAETAIVETMTALPGVTSVELRVEGKSIDGPATRLPLLYYAAANGLVAVPVAVTTPRAAIATYLTGPSDPKLTGLSPDTRLLNYQYDPVKREVSLNFSYTPTIRLLALDRPERMRFVLLGLIATLTEFSQVQTVRLDFEGQTRLGIGQCSDLLRTSQRRPELLNDERLLGR